MRKLYALIIVAIAMMFATPADAQVKFGLKGGLNVTNMSLSESVFDASNKAGFFIGPTVKLTLPIIGLSVDASALYDQKEAKVSADADAADGQTTTMRQKSINIPVNVRYGVGLSSLANVFVFAGPQWGINVGDENFKWNDSSCYSLKKSNFSVNLGLGATVLSHYQITANYNIACGKTADVTWKDASEQIVKGKSRNNTWQIGLAYFF